MRFGVHFFRPEPLKVVTSVGVKPELMVASVVPCDRDFYWLPSDFRCTLEIKSGGRRRSEN